MKRESADSAAVRWLAREYYELNGNFIEVMAGPPSALQFLRAVQISRPVIIKGHTFPAMHLWTDEHLIKQMGSRLLSVAVTPNGLADSVTEGGDGHGHLYFAEPLVELMTMDQLLSTLSEGSHSDEAEIHYLQSQNGNLFSNKYFEDPPSDSELNPLRQDVPSEVSWCSEALGRKPDAVNLWIGNGKSVTSIHSDPYENIYTVVRGAKHFTLLPPTEGWCLDERTYPHARYVRASDGQLVLRPTDADPVRWSSITNPHLTGNLPSDVHAIHITVRAGDTLYLPPGWWHHVRQAEETTIALNWWYDTEMRGMKWVFLSYLRDAIRIGTKEDDVEDEYL